MPDVHDPATRSFNMSRVRSRGNKSTELKLRELLRQEKITGWRRGYPLIGKPDFVFSKQRVAVFVDGCFWHGCKLGCKPLPEDSEFWQDKIAQNMRRDRDVTLALRRKGWRVIRIWEHALKGSGRPAIRRIKRALSLHTAVSGSHK